MFVSAADGYSALARELHRKNSMKFTTILAALALTLSAPAFARETKGTEKQSAPESTADTQERSTGNGRGTRNTASTTRNKTPLL
ncbi:hypothetical protein PhaeoP71_03705 (plasmid) [Phaeobacter piscinae]|nr:hypothetical protein PhaeoP71_03705 [Phaeobacter piscinae]